MMKHTLTLLALAALMLLSGCQAQAWRTVPDFLPETGGQPSGASPSLPTASPPPPEVAPERLDPDKAIRLLTAALQAQVRLNQLLKSAGVEGDAVAIQRAVQQGGSYASTIQSSLEEAYGLVEGDAREYIRIAADETISTLGLNSAILAGSGQEVLDGYEQLLFHTGTAVAAIDLALDSLGAGPSAPGVRHI